MHCCLHFVSIDDRNECCCFRFFELVQQFNVTTPGLSPVALVRRLLSAIGWSKEAQEKDLRLPSALSLATEDEAIRVWSAKERDRCLVELRGKRKEEKKE